ncbi:MAG: hypothetical protein ABTD50_04905 [Polyangiaceae bacterium]|jgi:hypothetical protein
MAALGLGSDAPFTAPQTLEQFAEGREFKGSTLRYWACILRRGAPSERRSCSVSASSSRKISIAKVVTTSAAQVSTIEIAVGPARVVVRAGFDRTLLRQVIEALGGRS